MGLQLPPEAIEALAYLGMTWPEADEELLLQRGERWLEFAEQGGEQRDDANVAVEAMLATNESLGLKAFEIYWMRVGGDWGHLNGSVVTAQAIGIAYLAAAALVLAMKLAVIVQLVALAVVLVAAIAAALETLGASLAAAAAYARTVYSTIQRIVKATIDAIGEYGPRLAGLVGSLLEIVTKVVESRPIHQGEDGRDGPQTEEERAAEQAERTRRHDEMSHDPDHGGKVTAGAQREADIALAMEEAGLMKPPVRRPDGPGQGDFIDGNGTHWDVKGMQSNPAGQGRGQAKGRYSDAKATGIIEKQLAAGRNVVLDLSGLDDHDRESLKALIRNNPSWHGRVVIH